MSEYNYINDYERECTQKYEGTYTPEEIELNKKLKEECSKEIIDYAVVEKLLKQGADPLGGTAVFGWELLEHIYGELTGFQDSNSINLPRLTELFLKYGMDVDAPRIPYDDDNSLNPLWFFSFVPNENSIVALKMLLDHGLSAGSFAEFWDHSMTDFFHVDCGDPENDEFWNKLCVWTFKMLLLGASYDRIFNADERIGEFICCAYNTNDIHMFRNWDDFEYHFDTSNCERYPQLYGSLIHIYSKKTGKQVWKIGVGTAGRAYLKGESIKIKKDIRRIIMALYLENLGLGFLRENENTFTGLVSDIVSSGNAIVGYYGLPYINKHYGFVQMIAQLAFQEDSEGLKVDDVVAHVAGYAKWKCRIKGMNIDKDNNKLSKRIMVSKLDSSGFVPVTLVNADVLPSFMEDDIIEMQMIAFPEIIEYFENEDDYADSSPTMMNGKKMLIAEGGVFPVGLLKNRNPEDPEFEKNEHLDDIVNVRGTVKSFERGECTFGEDTMNPFIICNIDTDFGPLQIVHSIEQVKEDQHKNMKAGATVNFYGLLSGDVAIHEYDKGIIRDEEHNLAALRYTFTGGDPERIRNILCHDCEYIAQYNKVAPVGTDKIIDRIKKVQEVHTDKYFAHFATISSIDEGEEELEYSVGKRCLVLASGEETNYESIVFINVNDEGNISRIITSIEPRYHFSIDEKPSNGNFFEDLELPETVAETILIRARFLGIIEDDIDDEAVISDETNNNSYLDNAKRMLEALQEIAEDKKESALEKLFGYLFAKAVEMEYNTYHPSEVKGIFNSTLTASYSPDDAFEGIIESGLADGQHEKLKTAMKLGRHFYKDFKFFHGLTEDNREENLMKSLMIVQRLGRLYSKKCLDW